MSIVSAAEELAGISRKLWRPWFRPLIVAVIASLSAAILISMPGKLPDFTVFWAAAHFEGPVYDSTFLTSQQEPGRTERPFAAPPTFLLIILPLGLLPMPVAYVLWVTLSAVALVELGATMSRYAWVVFFSPLTISVALLGQSTLLVAGLLACAFGVRRPRLSGALLGLAACIKPHLLLFVPVLLVTQRRWVEIQMMIATGVALCTAATIAFGPSIWLQWLSSLPDFVAINESIRVPRVGVTFPFSLLAAAVVVLLIYVSRFETAKAVVLALAGALLVSPHAPRYEVVAMFIPGMAAAGLSWRLIPLGYLMFAAVNSAALALVAAAMAWPSRSRRNHAGRAAIAQT